MKVGAVAALRCCTPAWTLTLKRQVNVGPYVYRVIVNEYTLLPDLPGSKRSYQVTVTLPRPDGDEALLPPEGQAVIELAAAGDPGRGPTDRVDTYQLGGFDGRGTAVRG